MEYNYISDQVLIFIQFLVIYTNIKSWCTNALKIYLESIGQKYQQYQNKMVNPKQSARLTEKFHILFQKYDLLHNRNELLSS